MQERLRALNISAEERAVRRDEWYGNRLRGFAPLSLSLRGAHGSIAFDGDDIRAKGVGALILERLKYCMSARFFGRTRLLFTVTFVVLFLALDNNRNWRNPAMFAVLTVCLLLVVASLMPLVLTRGPVLKLEPRSQRRTFFVRKKDELALALLMAVVGTILGVGSTLFVQSLSKKPADQKTSNPVAPQKN